MGIVEALVLLLMGLFSGVLATVFDVFVVGSASFLSHFSLWVLLNALLAVHVESRVRAVLWAIPFNLGYIESYFITTVASFEGYTKSLMVPLAAIALISPFLDYAIWTAKREKNAYCKVLSALIVIGTLVSSYLVKDGLGVYDVVVCVLLALVLFVMPVRRLKITRSSRDTVPAVVGKHVTGAFEALRQTDEDNKKPGFFSRRLHRDNRRSSAPDSPASHARVSDEPVSATRAQTHTRRVQTDDSALADDKRAVKKLSFFQRRAQRKQEELERSERLRASNERRSQKQAAAHEEPTMATLGNARQARRTNREA